MKVLQNAVNSADKDDNSEQHRTHQSLVKDLGRPTNKQVPASASCLLYAQ